jgi:hypothetical protein
MFFLIYILETQPSFMVKFKENPIANCYVSRTQQVAFHSWIAITVKQSDVASLSIY